MYLGKIALVCIVVSLSMLAKMQNTPILITTVPKAGTHLLAKVLQEMTGKTIKYAGSITTLNQREIKKLASKHFYVAHAPASPNNIQLAAGNRLKTILLVRDPRDVIISYVMWLKKGIGHTLEPEWPLYASLSEDEIIMRFIERYPTKGPQIAPYNSISEFYNLYLAWIQQPNVLVSSFEKLIGPQGGESAAAQIDEVIKIAQFINRPITRIEAERIAANLFGGTNTFREGKTGGWKLRLTQKHIQALKATPGFNELLIKLGYEKDENW